MPTLPTARTFLPVLLAGAALSLGAVIGATDANAAAVWGRTGTAYTYHGAYQGAVSGACVGGSCSRTAVVAGPYGGVAARSGTVTRTAPGAYSYSRTTIGPYGNSVTRSGTVSRY